MSATESHDDLQTLDDARAVLDVNMIAERSAAHIWQAGLLALREADRLRAQLDRALALCDEAEAGVPGGSAGWTRELRPVLAGEERPLCGARLGTARLGQYACDVYAGHRGAHAVRRTSREIVTVWDDDGSWDDEEPQP